MWFQNRLQFFLFLRKIGYVHVYQSTVEKCSRKYHWFKRNSVAYIQEYKRMLETHKIYTLNILFLNVYVFLCKAGTEMGLINKTQYLRITCPSRWMKTLITQFKNAWEQQINTLHHQTAVCTDSLAICSCFVFLNHALFTWRCERSSTSFSQHYAFTTWTIVYKLTWSMHISALFKLHLWNVDNR